MDRHEIAGFRAFYRILRAFCRVLPLATLFVTALAHAGPHAVTAEAFKLAGDATRMRFVLQFDAEPEPKWFLLRGPHRLVIDLPDTGLSLDTADLKPRGLISNVRYGNIEAGVSRLILTAKGPFELERVDVIANEASPGYRMVVDIVSSSDAAFDAALAIQAETTGSTSTPKGDRVGKTAPRDGKRFTVVLDPGHGGIDGGAEGVNGTVEKAITLSFALELKSALEASGSYDVYMTRETDVFLRLDERVRIARSHEADLLISIHADTIRLKNIRGATVYTVSEKASDAEAEATADRENLSDQLAGIEIVEENHQVADILVDLIRRETHSFSIRFARSLVGALSGSIELINNPHRSAGFRVLKAPDVPSVLVELGYLSNPKDEEQLLNGEWRRKAIGSISTAVGLFAEAKLGAGG
ncbi:N-acetylmuramoyl-L-alanine amidase [Albidovulum sp.]|uniref:N-acetylmuramoyl-L-alanine amidase n=1 Tax=Albidovulum sp. TaxID=1872424 RepID=UPI0039B96F40